eukprot:m.750230 g.750230  ORF g.750230 m.750230 type:complete len:568 (+) comp58979_c0_seq8:114-1817(+)
MARLRDEPRQQQQQQRRTAVDTNADRTRSRQKSDQSDGMVHTRQPGRPPVLMDTAPPPAAAAVADVAACRTPPVTSPRVRPRAFTTAVSTAATSSSPLPAIRAGAAVNPTTSRARPHPGASSDRASAGGEQSRRTLSSPSPALTLPAITASAARTANRATAFPAAFPDLGSPSQAPPPRIESWPVLLSAASSLTPHSTTFSFSLASPPTVTRASSSTPVALPSRLSRSADAGTPPVAPSPAFTPLPPLSSKALAALNLGALPSSAASSSAVPPASLPRNMPEPKRNSPASTPILVSSKKQSVKNARAPSPEPPGPRAGEESVGSLPLVTSLFSGSPSGVLRSGPHSTAVQDSIDAQEPDSEAALPLSNVGSAASAPAHLKNHSAMSDDERLSRVCRELAGIEDLDVDLSELLRLNPSPTFADSDAVGVVGREPQTRERVQQASSVDLPLRQVLRRSLSLPLIIVTQHDSEPCEPLRANALVSPTSNSEPPPSAQAQVKPPHEPRMADALPGEIPCNSPQRNSSPTTNHADNTSAMHLPKPPATARTQHGQRKRASSSPLPPISSDDW